MVLFKCFGDCIQVLYCLPVGTVLVLCVLYCSGLSRPDLHRPSWLKKKKRREKEEEAQMKPLVLCLFCRKMLIVQWLSPWRLAQCSNLDLMMAMACTDWAWPPRCCRSNLTTVVFVCVCRETITHLRLPTCNWSCIHLCQTNGKVLSFHFLPSLLVNQSHVQTQSEKNYISCSLP